MRSAIVRYLPFHRKKPKLSSPSMFHRRCPCSASDHARNSGESLGASAYERSLIHALLFVYAYGRMMVRIGYIPSWNQRSGASRAVDCTV